MHDAEQYRAIGAAAGQALSWRSRAAHGGDLRERVGRASDLGERVGRASDLRERVGRASDLRERVARASDLIVTAVLMLLVVGAPLARGAEDPAAAALLEQAVFALMAVWALKSALLQPRAARCLAGVIGLALPVAAFAIFVALQLVPLAPALLHVVSPQTDALYARARQWSGAGGAASWQPLSIAPILTAGALLKLLAYLCVMLLVAGYPLEPAADGAPGQTLGAALALAVLVSALLAGMAGAVALFAGHRGAGDLAAMAARRAQGTFHNPDHFANYLVLAFPIAVVGVLSPRSLVGRRWSEPFAVFAAMAAVVCIVGVLISLSRGAWLAGLVGSAALVVAVMRRERHGVADGAAAPDRNQGVATRRAALAGCLLFLLALVVAGAPAGQIGARLTETANHDESVLDRIAVWRDSLGIVRDFPLVGVGLGGWPEIFSRYDSEPWDPIYFWRETHNDFLQLLEETGIIGFLLAGWILLSQANALRRARAIVSARRLPLVAAAIAAAASFAAHELLDFNFQVPANALLLVVILGLAHRQAAESGVQWWQGAPAGPGRVWRAAGAAAVVALALTLIWYASRHDAAAYPYNLDAVEDAADSIRPAQAAARFAAIIRDYPAHAEAHRWLARALLDQRQRDAAGRELRIAAWLDPADPQAHDALAEVLFQQGDRAGSLKQITQSVARSPRPSTHPYTTDAVLGRLTTAEQAAVERGYRMALWNADAVYGLGYFYDTLARFHDRAALYDQAARREASAQTRLDYLLKAGDSYFAAADPSAAQAVLRQAALLRPDDPRSYRLMAAFYGSRRDLVRARAVVAHGIAAGADPVELNIALADVAWKAGDCMLSLGSLDRAMEAGPVGFDAKLQIGVMYLDCESFTRALAPLRAAVAADPEAADGYFYLAAAEENSYDFAAAAIAFKKALELAPDRPDIRHAYAAFQRALGRPGPAPPQANLKGANLNGADLNNADLNNASLLPAGSTDSVKE
jgi:Tfp pilus assembly protein PilF